MHGLIFETSICYWQDQPDSEPIVGRLAAAAGAMRRRWLGGREPPSVSLSPSLSVPSRARSPVGGTRQAHGSAGWLACLLACLLAERAGLTPPEEAGLAGPLGLSGQGTCPPRTGRRPVTLDDGGLWTARVGVPPRATLAARVGRLAHLSAALCLCGVC